MGLSPLAQRSRFEHLLSRFDHLCQSLSQRPNQYYSLREFFRCRICCRLPLVFVSQRQAPMTSQRASLTDSLPHRLIFPISSCDETTSPSCFVTSARDAIFCSDDFQYVLSVSISTISSSRLTASPTCLCQVAIEPSSTDSGNCGL